MGVHFWIETGYKPNANTILYMPFKEDLLDHSGNNISFTNTNVTLVDGTAYFNWSAKLVNSNFTSYLSAVPFTVSFWIKQPSIVNDGWLIVANKKVSGSWYWWDLQNISWKIRVESVGWGTNIFSNTLSTDTRYLVTAVYASGNKYLYMNGSLLASWTSTINSFRDEFRIWVNDADSWMTPVYINGYMSDLIMEKVAWTQQQVADYYNSVKDEHPNTQRYDADLSSSTGWTIEHSYWQPNEYCTISGWTITAPDEWGLAYQNINLDFSNASVVEFGYDAYPVLASWSSGMGVAIWSQQLSNQFDGSAGNCSKSWITLQTASGYNTATLMDICSTEVGNRYTTGTGYSTRTWTTVKTVMDLDNLTCELYIGWSLIVDGTFSSSLASEFRSNPNNVLTIYLSSYCAMKNLYITVQ